MGKLGHREGLVAQSNGGLLIYTFHMIIRVWDTTSNLVS